jgi:gliding motility-associated-like protein
MKRLLLILVSLFFSTALLAEHITGGEIFYTYLGKDGVNYRYRVTLKLFRNCGPNGAQLDPKAAIGIFNKTTNQLIWNDEVPMTNMNTLQLGSPGACITNAPTVCYEVGFYQFDVSLPASAEGYTIAYQRCCRIQGISNLVGSGNQGATYTANIPGTSTRPDAPENNSAQFVGKDTVIICGGYPFSYSFGAVDPDGSDRLSFSFCEAYVGGSSGSSGMAMPNPPAPPPYGGVSYGFGYTANAPLGLNVTIDPNTGLITGTSPDEGIYVVTVCVNEIRNGVVIATQRKDLQIKAGGCDIAKAQLDPEYLSCDGFTMNFSNKISSPLINSYYWEFGDPSTGVNNTSTNATPAHTFSAAGNYTIKLVTNRGQECSDSTTAIVKVYPGFFPAFSTAGICLKNPVNFSDNTTTNFGVVDSWRWDFGDLESTADTSRLQQPSWTYSTIGPKEIMFTVTNSMGCIKTIKDTLDIIDKPPITLAFNDTLICVPDAVQLEASGTGNFSWTPAVNMVNANTATPTVNPVSTTTYHVQLDEQGCINNDSVTVRVVDHVSLTVMNDTTICSTDPVQLRINSDGLQYQWTPASAFIDATVANPLAIAGTSNPYEVTAFIGSCQASRTIDVTAIPYPVANAGPDTTICYNTPAFLHGSHDGSSFNWSPTSSLTNATTLNPTAYPARTNQYVLTSLDTRGCPKPGRDTVLVTVLPRIRPFAGNDTLVVVGQPLQLNAEGGVSYVWIPATSLSNPNIKNPIAIYPNEIDSVKYTVQVYNEVGCYDSAFVSVKVFKTNPYVFVPTAFTPNGDGLNDQIRPIAVGVSRINYFSIYNRWGQLLFSTKQNGHGWDGRIGGVAQASNVFVWMVNAVDYTGKPIFIKGTVTLIR